VASAVLEVDFLLAFFSGIRHKWWIGSIRHPAALEQVEPAVSEANLPADGAERGPSSSLLRGVQEGRKEAWDRLVRLCAPLVYTWCRRAGLPAAEAADVGQEAFRAAAYRVGDFHLGQDGSFRGWLRAITHRAIYDHLCRHQGEGPAAGGQAETQIQPASVSEARDARPGEDREEAALLYRRAAELIRDEVADDDWRAFWTVDVEGRLPAEAVTALGMTPQAVHLGRARVRHRLRSEFSGILEP
jgi:RNA polymerase sigma factor (sigma-70 family)